MDPLTIGMLIAQGIPATVQMIQGIKQGRESKGIKVTDPIMPIPQSATEALANAERMASSRYMAGQTNLENRLDQATANTTSDILRTARSPQDALAALTSVHATNQAGENQIGFQAAQDYMSRQAELRGQLGIMSGWENKKWENDVLNRFLRDSAAKSALKNASMNNIYQGIKGVSQVAGAAAMGLLKTGNVTAEDVNAVNATSLMDPNSATGASGSGINQSNLDAVKSALAGSSTEFSTGQPQIDAETLLAILMQGGQLPTTLPNN